MKNDVGLRMLMLLAIALFGCIEAAAPQKATDQLDILPPDILREEIIIKGIIRPAKTFTEALSEIKNLSLTSKKVRELMKKKEFKEPIMNELLKIFLSEQPQTVPSLDKLGKLGIDTLLHGKEALSRDDLEWLEFAVEAPRVAGVSPVIKVAVDASLPRIDELGKPLDRDKAKGIIAYLVNKGENIGEILKNFEQQFATYYKNRVGHARGGLDPTSGGITHTFEFIAHETLKLIFEAINSGKTDLHVAAIRGDINKMNELIKTMPQFINQPDYVGNTPLHEAAWIGKLDVIRALLAAGADRNARNKQGETPSDKAKFNKQQSALDILTAASAPQPRVAPPPVQPQRPRHQGRRVIRRQPRR